MKRAIFLVSSLLSCFGIISTSAAEQTLSALHVIEPPVIDGIANEPAWKDAPPVTTLDKTGNLPIRLKAVYTDTDIFFQVSFPDSDESRTHKSWTWDKGREFYTVGHDREDVFVFKWNMEPSAVDLSIFADNSYLADIWYWKACRTDAAGYADDKNHRLLVKEQEDATKILSRSGKTMYLLRKGDEGRSAYSIDLITDYRGPNLPRYVPRQPSGSRGDVKAKGIWENGIWTIEFSRKLNTGHNDDLQFETDRKFLLGVSRYEIAGRNVNDKLSQPLYGTGDVNESLWLEFIQ